MFLSARILCRAYQTNKQDDEQTFYMIMASRSIINLFGLGCKTFTTCLPPSRIMQLAI